MCALQLLKKLDSEERDRRVLLLYLTLKLFKVNEESRRDLGLLEGKCTNSNFL